MSTSCCLLTGGLAICIGGKVRDLSLGASFLHVMNVMVILPSGTVVRCQLWTQVNDTIC